MALRVSSGCPSRMDLRDYRGRALVGLSDYRTLRPGQAGRVAETRVSAYERTAAIRWFRGWGRYGTARHDQVVQSREGIWFRFAGRWIPGCIPAHLRTEASWLAGRARGLDDTLRGWPGSQGRTGAARDTTG